MSVSIFNANEFMYMHFSTKCLKLMTWVKMSIKRRDSPWPCSGTSKVYIMTSYVHDCMQFSYSGVLIVSWTSRDPEAKDKMNPFAEQEAWEEHQIGNATYLKQTPTSHDLFKCYLWSSYIFRKRLTWKKTMYLFQENRNCDLDPKIRRRLQMSISKLLFLC
jgi:hypothetical protein